MIVSIRDREIWVSVVSSAAAGGATRLIYNPRAWSSTAVRLLCCSGGPLNLGESGAKRTELGTRPSLLPHRGSYVFHSQERVFDIFLKIGSECSDTSKKNVQKKIFGFRDLGS